VTLLEDNALSSGMGKILLHQFLGRFARILHTAASAFKPPAPATAQPDPGEQGITVFYVAS
jgi:hypothetical protein